MRMTKTAINPNEYNIGKYRHFYMYVDIEISATEGNLTSVTTFLTSGFNKLW